MELDRLLSGSLAVLTLLLFLLVGMCAIRHTWRHFVDARRARLVEVVRPQVLALLADAGPQGEVDLDRLRVERRSGTRTVEWIAGALLPKLRGTDRAALARILDRTGAIARARERTAQRGALGRARAAELLGAAGIEDALPDLVWLLLDRDREVRAVAARALGRLEAPEATGFLLATLDARRRRIPASVVGIALLHLGPVAVVPLLDGLGAASARARGLVAETLGLLGATVAAPSLRRLLTAEPDAAVRAHVALSLGRLADPEAVDPLVAHLGGGEPPVVRRAAARALGAIADDRASAPLEAALDDRDHRVAAEAARALAALGPAGVVRLEAAVVAVPPRPHAAEVLDLRVLAQGRMVR